MESIYIGILGLGTVGSGVLNTLEKNRAIMKKIWAARFELNVHLSKMLMDTVT